MLDIAIAAELPAAGVTLRLGVIQCRVTVAEGDDGLIEALTAESARRGGELAATPPGQVPEVAATRQAYKALGKDPSRYRPSAEALLRRIAQNKPTPQVNTVVDTNNLVSISTGLSCGAYDVARLAPPLVCRRGAAGESYDAIGRGPINLEGLPLLADASGPFGSPTSDSTRSMVTLEAAEILMVIFGFGETPLDGALDFAQGCLEGYCAAEALERAVVAAEP